MAHIASEPELWTRVRQHTSEIMTRQALRLLAPLRAGLRSTGCAGHPAAPWCALSSRGFASDADLKKTPLYDFHVEHGGNKICSLWQ